MPERLQDDATAPVSGASVLQSLERHDEFLARHIGTSPSAQEAMLREIGFASRAALMNAIVPSAIRSTTPLDLPSPLGEAEALAKLRRIASRNRVLKSFIGQGYYGTYTPGVIQRNVFENPAWYTAYTPYQPEISQGRLEALVNFQTMVTDLTGLAIANASMLDEATAAAEAMTLARRTSKAPEGAAFLVDVDCHPQTLAVIRTRAIPLGLRVETFDGDLPDGDVFGVLLQYPGSSGRVRDLTPVIEAAHERGAVVAVAADLL